MLAWPGTTRAQDLDRIAPSEPGASGGQGRISEPPLPELEDADAPLLRGLRGLVFVASVDAVRRDGIDAFEGIRSEGLPLLEEPRFRARIEAYLGQPASLRSLEEIAREVSLQYRAHDLPVVDAFIPEQDITSGVVQIAVIEGRVGALRVTGNRWFSRDQIARGVRLDSGDPIHFGRLRDDLDWVNRNPFRAVEAVIAPGTEQGYTDVELSTHDRLPLRFFAGVEDSGSPTVGRWRSLGGFNWGNAFWLGHGLDYQYTRSIGSDDYEAHAGNWRMPLPWRHELSFFGGWARSSASLDDPLTLEGTGWQVSGRYEIPLPSRWELRHAFSGGFDFKRSTNDLDFGGSSVFDTPVDVAQGVLGYEVARPDRFGGTQLAAHVLYSPGGISKWNDDAAFDSARAGADPRYAYVTLDVERDTRLPLGFLAATRAGFQWTRENLVPSEQMGLGGARTVRGYDERDINGDSGWRITQELRTPFVSVARRLGVDAISDAIQLLAFADVGELYLAQPLPDERSSQRLASAGLGVRLSVGRFVSVRYDYGWQLRESEVPDYARGGRGHLSVVVSMPF